MRKKAVSICPVIVFALLSITVLAGCERTEKTDPDVQAVKSTMTMVSPSGRTFQTGTLEGGTAVLVDDLAAYWVQGGTVYAANGHAKSWSPSVQYARKANISYDSVKGSVRNEETEHEQKAPDDAYPRIEAKKPAESTSTIETQIVCDKFELVTKVTGSTLDFSIDTDLPDNAVVMVSVSRSYLEKGNPATYSVDYFSEKSTIGKWKSKHSISIASEEWKTALRAKQEDMSRLGLGFDVASISDKITVSMVVPINQPDPKFGDWNQNLTGNAVSTKGIRVVEDEIEIDYPLNAPPMGKSPFPSLNPLELEIGQAYVVSTQTPLMPSHSPADPIAAIQQIKQIPQGGGFKVLEVYKGKANPWYKVIAFDQRTEQIGTGWINSTALLGQQLKA